MIRDAFSLQRRWTVLLVMAATVTAIVVLVLVTRLAAQRTEAQIRQEAEQSAGLLAALLASEIEHYQALPVALATDSDIRDALLPGSREANDALSRRMALISDDIGSAAIYLVRADGRTIAASNAGTAASFIGHNYRFRDYFRDAMRDGVGRQFAMGSTTLRPGLFLSRRVDDGSRALGVVVVKVEFVTLESDWRRSGSPSFVTDPTGELLITSDPQWRFARMTAILDDDGPGKVRIAGDPDAGSFVAGSADTIVPGWTLHALVPVSSRIGDAATAAGALTALALAFGAAATWLIWQARQREHLRQQAQDEALRMLEDKVAQRTTELSAANVQLRDEMAERRRVAEQARLLHEELEQANRLTMLGQISAGVTHEINQPVAAIRATADNAGVLLARGDVAAARTALTRIAGMTDRIGKITGELRAFAARRSSRPRLISVDTAIDGALLLVGSSLRHSGVALDRPERNPDLKLWADRIRIEQILVNLLRNAIDAVDGRPDPRIAIGIGACAERIDILVADNGPGIAADVASTIFTPFQTTKEHGLGLGLVISRDIAASLGGELNIDMPEQSAGSRPGGATFRLSLPRAG